VGILTEVLSHMADASAAVQRGKLCMAEVYEFAKYLGMDPDEDRHLLWIAQQALNATLPAVWTEHKDEEGNTYYFNADTGESSWEHPLDDYFRKLYARHKTAEAAQDRFPAFVTFPVKDESASAAAKEDDPVGPRERVKQWVINHPHDSTSVGTRGLKNYTTSASDTTLFKKSESKSGTFEIETRRVDRTKRGSWHNLDAVESKVEINQTKATASLSEELEKMDLSSRPKQISRKPISRHRSEDTTLKHDASAATIISGQTPGNVPNGAVLTLSEAFNFPGAVVNVSWHEPCCSVSLTVCC
jgi:hypothetical protein